MSRIKTVKKYIDKRLLQATKEQASTATIIKIDGNLATIRLFNHQTNLNHCRIVGDPEALSVGQTVSLRWEDYNGTKRPVVMGPSAGGGGVNQASGTSVVVDNQTIEYSDYGLRVKPGGIGLEHLNFVVASAEHTHNISEWLAGWNSTPDGILYTEWTSISPDGAITLGRSPDLVILDASDPTYRIWAGDIDPSTANFSVSKSGQIKAHSGDIAGWTINSTEIKKSGIVLDSSADQIKVGASAPNIVLDGAGKMVKSSNFASGVSGFGMYATNGDAEFNNVTVRGTIRASVFNVGEITATAGSSGVWKSAAEVYAGEDLPTPGNTVDIDLKNSDAVPGAALLAQYDVIRIKAWNGTSIVDTWGTITAVVPHTGYSTYTVKIESGGGVRIEKGMACVDYGVTGDGHIIQSADDTVGASANLSIADIVAGEINTHALGADGSGYYVNDVLTIAGGTGGTIRVTSVDGGPPGAVLTYVLVTAGYGYTTGVKATSGGSGTGCTISITDINGPWDGVELKARLGNMNGSYGAGADRYGIGIGDFDAGNYMSYNAEAADTFILKGGGGAITLDTTGIRMLSAGTGTGVERQYRFMTGDGSTTLGYLEQFQGTATSHQLQLIGNSYDSKLNEVYISGTGGIRLANPVYTAQALMVRGSTLHPAYSSSGVGLELAWLGSYGRLLSYNRSTGQDQPLYIRGSEIRLREGGTDILRIDGGDVFTQGFANYSSSSTAGWSSLSTKKVYYKTVGDWVFIQFELYGTSNNSSVTFTVPYANNGSIQAEGVMRGGDSGGAQLGMVILPVSSTTVTCYRDPSIGAWATSSTKWVSGQFWYQRA